MSQVDIPSQIDLFYGDYDPYSYFSWEENTNACLEYHGYDGLSGFMAVVDAFRGDAYDWWMNDLYRRRLYGLEHIVHWNQLRIVMRMQFVPLEQARRLEMYNKCKQGFARSPLAYFVEIEELLNFAGLSLSLEHLCSRFYDGLNTIYREVLEHQLRDDVNELVRVAMNFTMVFKGIWNMNLHGLLK